MEKDEVTKTATASDTEKNEKPTTCAYALLSLRIVRGLNKLIRVNQVRVRARRDEVRITWLAFHLSKLHLEGSVLSQQSLLTLSTVTIPVVVVEGRLIMHAHTNE
jgi:hypothetical protein